MKNNKAKLSVLLTLSCAFAYPSLAADANIVLAKKLITEGQFADAASKLKEVTKVEPTNEEAWRLLGGCYAQQLNAVEATAALQEAVKLDPKDALAWYMLGQAQWPANEKLAISDLEQATSLKPDNAEFWSTLATVALSSDKTKALAAAKKAVALNANDQDAWLILRSNSGTDLKTAHNAALHLVLISPNDPNEWLSYGLTLHAFKREAEYKRAQAYGLNLLRADKDKHATTPPQSTLKSLQLLAELEPAQADVWHKLASVLQSSGDKVGAKAAQEKALHCSL